ncbi:DNA helicase-2 / ATP-dependent DNA helicase PcrA [Geoalkalibacter ferrihydriticus]|uniref:DNA 3'-5' helicase n=2 Tax=Geoalkalibacter ferrihydriticus TaxID=392333 RepID=A0A0C2HTM9_9BACT|nr:UvrD-helicase domain-containing protein [Geoalkalibacter ferrihydriticus]KIH76187.1 ATP-dependent DNA helicase Rep [Geoalkalibacter ferrihydriticus DSM 17813]SDM42570.1 DNA helicase-2 / ATP-dependent DNA helicase PcrA [Geoalkalibacter ferrihydriticus]
MDLSLLNPQQLEAARHGEGPLLILAGAGSGKTRVITCRIAHLSAERGVAPHNILAVTFTNKAAREMRERVEEMLGRKGCKAMVIATFHSLCVRILREDIEALGYKKNFSIYSTADQVRLVKDLMQQVDIDGRKFDAERVLYAISDAKNRLVPPEKFAVKYHDDYEYMAAEIYPRYQKSLKAFNAVDFDDLIMLVARLLREYPAVLEKYRERFRYILVDEYQDTNAAQYLLLKLLAGGHHNLCVVGDDDQSIYGWRGADLGNILEFERDFPAARVVKLEQNYRSTGNILAAANSVIKNNTKRREKALWTSDGAGPKVDYLLCEDEEDEARAVMERIHGERFRQELSYSDFAILYRTNVQSRSFEEQLRYENIPYVLIGGQQFFDRKEVKDCIAYLKVLVNPRDEVNLLRILNYPKRGIGETTADRLIRHSAKHSLPLWQVLKEAAGLEDLGEKAQESIAGFVTLMERYRQRFNRHGLMVETLRELVAELRLEQEIYRTVDDPKKARRRVENMEEVANAMASYLERDESPSLPGFLEKVSLLDDDRPGRDSKERKLQRDAVVLMSIHSSKGLEFPQVFLVGMEEEFLPHKKTLTETFNLDEERRLCYVGITRARRNLVLTGARRRKKYGEMQPRVPSRFLDEIPTELLNSCRSEQPPELPAEEKEQRASKAFANIMDILGD